MHTFILTIFLILLGACQSTPQNLTKRSIASSSYLTLLIKEIARESRMGTQKVEQTILNHIKQNSQALKQFSNLKTLRGNHPELNKLANWSSHNLAHLFPHMKPQSYIKIYERTHIKLHGGKIFI